jgi:adenylate cyclase
MAPHDDRSEWSGGVRAALVRRLIVANVAGAALVLVYFDLTTPARPQYRGHQLTRTGLFLSSFGLFAALATVLVLAAVLLSRRVLDRHFSWLGEDREPSDAERDALLAAPLLNARFILPFWLVAAVVTAVATQAVWTYRLRLFIGVVLAAASTLALSYLLVEEALRPVLAMALADHSFEKPTAMSLRIRQVVAWALGSGIPIAFVAVIPLGRRGPQLYPIAVPLVFMCVVALVAGSIVSVSVAHSIAAPIDIVRDALGRIRAGDLDVRVPVNDAGEIGLLQAGLNEMAAGLRERERLHDLFGRHVGEEVARRALETGVGLRGEQRDVTVFFVDLVGSTSLTESREPDDVIAILNRLFGSVVRAVTAEKGWVNKFEGDAALCVFGAPGDQDDHATRALRAALRLRDELAAFAAELGVSAGIGVSSGTVVAGNIGAEERYEYTVIGSPVNEAARLTDEAKRRESRLLASAECVRRAGAPARWRSCGTVSLRGLASSTEIFEPASAVEATDRLTTT